MEVNDRTSGITTEVHIRKNHSHLPHLCKIVSCMAGRLGMNRKDIEATEITVSEVCRNSIDLGWNCQTGDLSIKFSTHETYMTVEVTDPSGDFGPVSSGDYIDSLVRPGILEKLSKLTDGVELVKENESYTIRITKYAQKPEPVGYLAALGTASLQS